MQRYDKNIIEANLYSKKRIDTLIIVMHLTNMLVCMILPKLLKISVRKTHNMAYFRLAFLHNITQGFLFQKFCSIWKNAFVKLARLFTIVLDRVRIA